MDHGPDYFLCLLLPRVEWWDFVDTVGGHDQESKNTIFTILGDFRSFTVDNLTNQVLKIYHQVGVLKFCTCKSKYVGVYDLGRSPHSLQVYIDIVSTQTYQVDCFLRGQSVGQIGFQPTVVPTLLLAMYYVSPLHIQEGNIFGKETTRSLTLQLHDTFPEAQPDLLVTQSRRCSGTLRAWKDSTIERAHRPGHSMCYPWSTLAGYSSLYTDVYQTSLRMV
jgi:hypothetical protein